MTNKDFPLLSLHLNNVFKTRHPTEAELMAHWMLSDWDAVVKHWTIVEKTQPDFPY